RRARYRDQAGDRAGRDADRAAAAPMSPQTALDHFLTGLEALRERREDEALEACQETLRSRPRHFWAHFVQAVVHLRRAEYGLALRPLTGCLGLQPTSPWPRLYRATAQVELGLLKDAERDFQTVLEQAQDPLIRYA